jgi:hypothetical protein
VHSSRNECWGEASPGSRPHAMARYSLAQISWRHPMNCIHCDSSFHRRPYHYYFCSQMCWEVAKRDTAWRILSDGFGPLRPVKFAISSRYP